ncbi:MAG: pirin family protein [Pseudomonadota bacterium]
MAIATLLKAHDKDLGGALVVRRLLPAAARQAVGPFIFFDHFGPLEVPAEANHDVRAHPHIGLATVSYLFEGALEHRDSVGSVQRIEPGAINWMTAGRGIVHSERTPLDLRGQARRSHGLQLWAALPQANEHDAPSFSHTPAAAIPCVAVAGGTVRVLVGSAFGVRSPVATPSETLYLDVQLGAGALLAFEDLPAEAALYAVSGGEGALLLDGAALPAHTMALLEPGRVLSVRAVRDVRFVLIGGAPLDGRRFIWWNFVASDKQRLLQAADDWEQQRFEAVPGETEYIPLPERPRSA